MKKSLAVITARGGSKRIPHKNIKEFCGKPIIAYSIEAALQSNMFDDVMVSTDDEEIAEIAKSCGATVPFMRSNVNANDFASTTDVLLEVIDSYKKIGREFSYMCCIYPTAPFVTSEKLVKAMKVLQREDVQTVMPVVQFSFPPMRGMYIRGENLEFCHPEHAFTRSQDLEKMYHDCGQFYCVKVEDFLAEKKLVMPKTKAIIVSERDVQDIDTEEDWAMAEMKYHLLYKD